MQYIQLILICGLAILVLAVLGLSLLNKDLWQQSQLAGVALPLHKLILLKQKGIPVRVLIDAYARTRHTHYDLSFEHYLDIHHRGGNPTRVSMALASAHAAGLKVDQEDIIDVELHRMDAFDYVHQEIQKLREATRRPGMPRFRASE